MTDGVVDLAAARDRGPSAEFERTPPQDLAAEQSVLGGMLLSKDAIADVVEVVRSTDFYRPAHQTIFDVVVDLYGRGEPADPITVSAELTRTGELARVGGAPYLHTLLSSVPTAANAGYYARIVAEQAILRRLVEAGTRIVQLGYSTGLGDVDDVVDRAQQAVYDVTEKRTSEDYTLLEDLMQPTMDELEAIGSRGGSMTGVPTGFADLDQVTNGLHPGQLVIIAARPGLGKALALDTPLPTPSGWTTMGEVSIGEQLLGADGRPTTVVGTTEVMTDRPCFEVTFSDGTKVVADAQHQWWTTTRAERRAAGGIKHSVRTTAELADTVRCATADARVNHAVPVAAALDLPDANLLVPPYTLGAWLGDGHSAGARLTSFDHEILMHIEAEGVDVVAQGTPSLFRLALPRTATPERTCIVCGTTFTPALRHVRTCGKSCGGRAKAISEPVPVPPCMDCGGPSCGGVLCQACRDDHGTLQALLRKLGVLNSKHIPAAYLRGSERQRRALLAGLMDTDGTVAPGGNLQFAVTSERLARDAQDLVLSLGYRCTITRKPVPGRTPESSICYTLNWSTADEVFRLERKRLAHKERCKGGANARQRFITSVVPVESVPVRCVQVDNQDHLYLATRSMIPTHNSTLGLDISRTCSVKNGMASVIFSLEMTKTEITMRLLSAEARVPLHHMRAGTMTDDDWARLARRMGEVADAPLFIDDSPNLTMMEIRAKARRLKQRHNLKLVVVDYLQLMQGNKKAESRQQEVSELSRSLKLLAKELECPVIAMSQLNRGPEQRQDKKPMLSDLRESGCLPASTRILRADTGAETTMGELFATGARDVPVWSLDDSLRYVRRHLTHVFSTGTRDVYRLRLASGKTIRATTNHPFLTYDGWKPLGELAPGSRLAVPRHVPAPDREVVRSDDDVRAAAVRLAARGDVPAETPALPKRQLRLLLRELFARTASSTEGRTYLLATRAAADAVSRLLLRFGISTSVSAAGQLTAVSVSPGDDLARFTGQIESGLDGDAARDAVLQALRGEPASRARDRVWSQVEAAMTREVVAPAGRLAGVATALLDDDLELEATNDVFWDTVVEVVPDGVEEVFDATVVGNHNFIADGVAVHNSIEQDADMVVLLHREDAYEKESPRAGEADFIVAKHRNGPTATITVAFQGHYSRFVDMSPS
ncbi:MAG: replicative helicase [Actinomycetota bacterium]|nr:replicative helicase [Actinomycetota bacterium]